MTDADDTAAAPNPVEQLLDVVVYAPLGFAMQARTLIPELAKQARQNLDGQLSMAKMMGQFAVQAGSAEANKTIGNVGEQVTTRLRGLGLLPRPATPSVTRPATPPSAAPAAAPAATAAPKAKAAAKPAEAAADKPLAIPDYDALSATQVIPRLEALSTIELLAVKAYEEAKRGRKTILNKIAQLQG